MVVVAERALVEGAGVAVVAEERLALRTGAVRRFVLAGRTRSGEEVLVTERHGVDVDQSLGGRYLRSSSISRMSARTTALDTAETELRASCATGASSSANVARTDQMF